MLAIMTFSNKALVDSPASSPIPTSPQHSLFSYLYKMTQVANIHNAKSRAFPQNFLGFLGMSHLRINPCPKCQFSVNTSRSISFVISAVVRTPFIPPLLPFLPSCLLPSLVSDISDTGWGWIHDTSQAFLCDHDSFFLGLSCLSLTPTSRFPAKHSSGAERVSFCLCASFSSARCSLVITHLSLC